MANRYFYRTPEGAKKGPVPEDLIKQLLSSGLVRPDTLLWRDSESGWKPISSFPEFDTSDHPFTPPPTFSEAEPERSAQKVKILYDSTANRTDAKQANVGGKTHNTMKRNATILWCLLAGLFVLGLFYKFQSYNSEQQDQSARFIRDWNSKAEFFLNNLNTIDLTQESRQERAEVLLQIQIMTKIRIQSIREDEAALAVVSKIKNGFKNNKKITKVYKISFIDNDYFDNGYLYINNSNIAELGFHVKNVNASKDIVNPNLNLNSDQQQGLYNLSIINKIGEQVGMICGLSENEVLEFRNSWVNSKLNRGEYSNNKINLIATRTIFTVIVDFN